MVVDYFLEDFRKYVFLLLVLTAGCKENSTNVSTDENRCIPIINNSLRNELERFVSAHPLLGIEGNTYVLKIQEIKKDTIITIERSFKPVLINSSLNFKGAFYHQDNPVLLIDEESSLGIRFYESNCFDEELYTELGKAEHPTSLYKYFVSSSFKVYNDILIKK